MRKRQPELVSGYHQLSTDYEIYVDAEKSLAG